MSEKRPMIQVGNNTPRPMTDAEYAEYLSAIERTMAEMPKPEPTPEERMNEIEAALIELAAMMAGGM